ncbi:hypothetical protein C8F04DRAFT_1113104 [Mycena alexandri]|uniref:F-box domain-containing protein n=1 Tax=Mycena alexandri TaxID=1745969 RepID=A0AAD6WZU5_9AGAR|nr:hypothetical protein C8F04DRAFT_1113104 [Mycena alexandri]
MTEIVNEEFEPIATSFVADPDFTKSFTEDSEDLPRDTHSCPALTLPYDIMAEIFLCILPAYPTPPPIFGRLSPSLLAQICRKWREIALNTPALWRAFSISSYQSKFYPQRSRHLLEISLDRSGSFPLAIKLGERVNHEPGLTEIVQIIAQHSARLENIELSIIAPLDRLPAVELPLPLLRTLRLGDLKLTTLALTPTFVKAPLLRKLDLQVCSAPFRSIFPWSQLTVLDVGWIMPGDCMDILSLLVNIVVCRLNVDYWIRQADESRHVTLPRLETFIFETFSSWQGAPSSLLDTLTLPALKRLDIAEILLPRDNPVASLATFVARSGCDLSELCIVEDSSWRHHQSRLQDYRDAFPFVASFIFDGRLDLAESFLRGSAE